MQTLKWNLSPLRLSSGHLGILPQASEMRMEPETVQLDAERGIQLGR